MPVGFGDFLQRLRGDRKLSFRELGQLSEVDHAYIHRLETGEKEAPSEDVVNRLIRVLKPGERKARILRFLVSRTVEEDLLDEVLNDPQVSIDDFESAAQMSFRGRPSGREGWRRVLSQIRKMREQLERG